jgi:hypothetical protein
MPANIPSRREVHHAFRHSLTPGQQTAVVSWLSFTTTFSAVRAITYSIKDGKGPLHDIKAGGVHLHHYLWGILTVSGVGGVALRGDERFRRHPLVAAAYGLGLALIVDEFALLLDLEDVYWAEQGRLSVDVAIGMIAGAGSLLASWPMFRHLREARKHPRAR